MTAAAAGMIWMALAWYAAAGAVFAALMLAVGLRRLDPRAHAAPLRVKALLVPGLVALWPVMLARLAGGRS
jgi:hypothetical protein